LGLGLGWVRLLSVHDSFGGKGWTISVHDDFGAYEINYGVTTVRV